MNNVKPDFSFESEPIEDKTRIKLKRNDSYLSFIQVFSLWKESPSFIEFYRKTLLEIGYAAFYWEHPALSEEFLECDYECILCHSKRLEYLSADEEAFREHVYSQELVVDFMNLGKNARLVVPTKQTEEQVYNHLAKFLRMADIEQVIEVFKRVGKVILEEIEKHQVVWLSTAGLGVIWLHIRMDIRPKYYKTGNYKDPLFLKN